MAPPEDAADPAPPPGAAIVTPRGRSDASGEVLPIVDLVQPFLDARAVGVLQIVGPAGSGKSIALAHLSSAIGPRAGVAFLDEPASEDAEARAAAALVVVARAKALPGRALATIEMAPWGDDDAIEYVLAAHRERRESVMRRVLADAERAELLLGLPELWRIVLDELAGDDALPDVGSALRRRIDRLLPAGIHREWAAQQAWNRIALPRDAAGALPDREAGAHARLLEHRPICLLLAAEHVLARLAGKLPGGLLITGLPRELVPPVARLARAEPFAVDVLSRLVAERDYRSHAAAASLLLAIDPSWRPPGPPAPRMGRALLRGARWSGADLTGAYLSGADLSSADLSRANLSRAFLFRARLRDACLASANLAAATLDRADLRNADLSGARLEKALVCNAAMGGATLAGAVLSGAFLTRSYLDGADLSRADLVGARLHRARLNGTLLRDARLARIDASDTVFRNACLAGADFSGAILERSDFEGMELEAPCFRGADLLGAHLTDSVLPGADFRGANLVGAELGGVEWEGADLRDADLGRVSFHMGSSRSGLVNSPLASEGTRTGYYTDDAAEQDFKAPEEIRKANLRGADLRGAKVEEVDWYLVDLRDTRHTPAQREHFVRCRAILRDRTGPR